jgi:RNA polymerase sigma-B factor
MPLARKLARRYQYAGEPLDDLVQVASLGLVKAARRYDESRGIPFGAYAVVNITGELRRHLRDHGWAIHVPRGLKDRAVRVNGAIRETSGQSGGPPSAAQLGARLGLSEQEVLDAREVWPALQASSLDGPVWGRDESEPQPLAETIGSIDDGYELAEKRFTLQAELRRLSVRDRQVLQMRFFEGRTQRDIATRIGMSQMQVSRILSGALERLQLAAGPALVD